MISFSCVFDRKTHKFAENGVRSGDTREEAIKPVVDFTVYEDDHVVDLCPEGFEWHPFDLNEGARKETCSLRGCGKLDSRNIYFCSKK